MNGVIALFVLLLATSSTAIGLSTKPPPRSIDAYRTFASPLASSTMAFPMLVASSAPFGLGNTNANVIATTTPVAPLNALLDGQHPNLAVSFLNEIFHVFMECFLLFEPTESIFVRGAAVMGQMLTLAADNVPDHLSILPEEHFLQFILLGTSWISLIQSVIPVAFSKASQPNLSMQDRKAYLALFHPAGIEWSQFQALSACAMEWVSFDEGEIITSDEEEQDDGYLFWLFKGDITVQSQGKEVYDISSKGGRRDSARGVLGEMNLLRRFEKNKKNNKSMMYPNPSSTSTTTSSIVPSTTAKAGPSGATVLKIHLDNLDLLMDNDPDLADSVRTILFQGLQAKLTLHLQQAL